VTGGLLVIVHEDDAGPGRLEPWLPLPVDLRKPHRGDELPPDLSAHTGLLVLGGAMGAGDDEVAPWLPATRTLLAEAVAAEVPAVGICLGAQLLAVATGGQVERGSAGLEVGLVETRLLPAAGDDALLGPIGAALGQRLTVPQWHQDAITRLPPNAALLAEGKRYPHQAFRVGPAAWGLQYHPEVTSADFKAWMRDGHGSVRAAGQDPDTVLAAMAAAESGLAALADSHGKALSAVL
jgi:GMP synthase (glutamine-hydrolysing)